MCVYSFVKNENIVDELSLKESVLLFYHLSFHSFWWKFVFVASIIKEYHAVPKAHDVTEVLTECLNLAPNSSCCIVFFQTKKAQNYINTM